MFTIHRRNLSNFNNTKEILFRNIHIILRKINIILLVKINKPCTIFNELEQHVNHKKLLNKISILNHIYKDLQKIYNNLKQKPYDEKKVKLLLVRLVRK